MKLMKLACILFTFSTSQTLAFGQSVSNDSEVNQYCSGHASLSIDSPESLFHSVDQSPTEVTIYSSIKHGYEKSAYNLTFGCFARTSDCYKKSNHSASDQVFFNHGGSDSDFQVSEGALIAIESNSLPNAFETLSLEHLQNGSPVTLESIYGRSSSQHFRAPFYHSADAKVGDVYLIIINQNTSNNRRVGFREIHKVEVLEVSPGDFVRIRFQKIARIEPEDERNYFCSVRERILASYTPNLPSRTASIFTGKNGSLFGGTGFDIATGLTGEESYFIGGGSTAWLSLSSDCNQQSQCVKGYLGYVGSYWSAAVDLGTGVDPLSLTRESFPPLQTIPPKGVLDLQNGHTYLMMVLNSTSYTFAAVRVDSVGTPVQVTWKLLGVEEPHDFVKFHEVAITEAERTREITLPSWNTVFYSALNGHSGEQLLSNDRPYMGTVQASIAGTKPYLATDHRYGKKTSGFVDITGSTKSIDPNDLSSFTGKFQRDLPVYKGQKFLLVSQDLFYRAVGVGEVLEASEAQGVRFRFTLLYRGQTFKGKWSN